MSRLEGMDKMIIQQIWNSWHRILFRLQRWRHTLICASSKEDIYTVYEYTRLQCRSCIHESSSPSVQRHFHCVKCANH